jgi:hypothetical protein
MADTKNLEKDGIHGCDPEWIWVVKLAPEQIKKLLKL